MTAPASGTFSRGLWLGVVFLSGAGTMLLELVAPRLVQPWFGASSFVWTNVIGVILVALSVGYFLGGRWAERPGRRRRIASLLIAPALIAFAIPFAAPGLAGWLSPDPIDSIALGDARRQLELASLVAAILLFAPPVLLLAAVTPQVIAELADSGLEPGRAAGRVFAVGTLGSLVGTFLPTYLLVPLLGSRMSIVASGGMLAVAGLLVLLGPTRRGGLAMLLALPLAFGIGAAASGGPLRAAIATEAEVEEIESAYQYLRVARETPREPALAGRLETVLKIDEGLRDFHSVLVDGRPDTGGKYYDTVALMPALLPADRELEVAILGSGAGTTARMLREQWGNRIGSVVNVDVDPAVLALEERFGWRPVEGRDVSLALDGRAFLRLSRHAFDLLVVDAYARQIDIPSHMATVEFFRLAHSRLRAGGVLALNASALDLDGDLVQALLRSLRDAGFDEVQVAPVRHWGNAILYAARSGRLDPARLGPVPETLETAARDLRRLSRPVEPRADAPRLVDGNAPVEWLTQRALGGEG
ncbi:MAG: fused MFS/spermidine synthase [Planctomycetota bacterium]